MSDDTTTYERWKERVAQNRREAEANRKARELTSTRELAAGLARLYGNRVDNGRGECRHCGITLGTDADGNRTHPEPERCPGPEPEACEGCGGHFTLVQGRGWVHACPRPSRRLPTHEATLERVQTPGEETGGAFGYRR